MSSEDLAIDVGLAKDSDEFVRFVRLVDNILELGSTYSSRVTEEIVDKCRMSELDIASRVIRECTRTRTSSVRQSRLKWWQTYEKRYKTSDVPTWPGRGPDKRRMALFERTTSRPRRSSTTNEFRDRRDERDGRRDERHYGRRDNGRRDGRMSPLFRPASSEYEPERRKRAMSPLFEQPRYERRGKKRRRR